MFLCHYVSLKSDLGVTHDIAAEKFVRIKCCLLYDCICSYVLQGSISKATISPVPSSTHVRTMRKGSSDHIAVNIDSESSWLIDNEEAVEDKGLENNWPRIFWYSITFNLG